jgi:hypothetical protein
MVYPYSQHAFLHWLQLYISLVLEYCVLNLLLKVERRYGRKYGCDPAGRGAHLHANWSFSPPPTLMAMKLPTIGNHI